MSRRSVFIVLLIAFNIVIDQVSKIWVRANVEAASITEIIGNKFILTNVENKGAFLGMGSDLSPTLRIILLLVLPVIVLSMVLFHVFREKYMDRLSLIGFCFILGGGIGNIYDRIAHGSVTDFWRIDLGGIFKTGIFNVADMSVTSGMIILLTAAFLIKKKDKKSAV